MHQYNKSRSSRVSLSPKERYLIGPQFMLHASATAVQERPTGKTLPGNKNADPLQMYQTRPSRPLSFGEGTLSSVVGENLSSRQFQRQGSSGSSSRRTYVASAAFVQDLGAPSGGGGDADRRSCHSLSSPSQGNAVNTYLPGDKILFGESSAVPGVPVVYRSPEERTTNVERLNLDRRHFTVCPILEGEDQLRLLNFQHNAIQQIEHLEALKRLIFLDFYDNQIEKIEGLNSLKSLRVLMLGKNKIKKIENLDALMKLDVLDLHGNQIKHIENLTHLTDLRVLNLAGNQIEHAKNLRGLDSLMELNLRRNKIQTVADIDFLPNIQRLFLSFNEIAHFDDISCLSQSASLSELSLDGNPLSHDLSYKQTILRSMQQIKQLDMKRITDDERRIASVMGRKEEEKRRENSKMAVLVEKRRRTINNARQHWEKLVMARAAGQSTSTGINSTMPDLYAKHVANIPNSSSAMEHTQDDEESSQSSGDPSQPSSAKSSQSDKDWSAVLSTIRPKSAGAVTGASTLANRRIQPDKDGNRNQTTDSLSEIEGDTLNLYGLGSLDAFDKSWGMQAAGSVTTVFFQFIDFEEIVKVLPKIRVRFPNVNSLSFSSTNIHNLIELNALSSVRRLDRLIIEPDGNPVTQLTLWRPYVIFRLAHFGLKKVNGSEISVSDIVAAEKFFAVLANTASSSLPKARLMTLLGEKKKQLLVDEKAKRASTELVKMAPADKTETIGRAVLTYTVPDVSIQKDLKAKNVFIKTYLQSLTSEAIQFNRKSTLLFSDWSQVISDIVHRAILDMWDNQAFMKRCMEELEIGKTAKDRGHPLADSFQLDNKLNGNKEAIKANLSNRLVIRSNKHYMLEGGEAGSEFQQG